MSEKSSNTYKLSRPQSPLLSDLGGMREARAWGERLAADLAAYIAGDIAWAEVDPGVLLYGQPGTGKTTNARALAATCRVPLIAASYSQWQRAGTGHMGDVLGAIHDDFALAKKHAPSILFIDELDTLPTRRASRRNDDWWTGIINGFLEELDGAEQREGVVVIGACNDPTSIDPAILRAGRFDRRIEIPMPTIADLDVILRYHLGASSSGIDDIPSLAILTAGMSGADVNQLVRDARRVARQAKEQLSRAHIVRVIEGSVEAIDPSYLRRIALHEAGHAVAALRFETGGEVTVSLVGKGGVGGRTTLPGFEQNMHTRRQLEARLVVMLSGRAAEEVHLGEVSGGAGGTRDSDLAQATLIATDVVTTLGLSERRSLLWLGRHCTENPVLFNREIAAEVEAILAGAYAKAIHLMREQRAAVAAIAEALIERRALGHERLTALAQEHGGSQRLLAAPAHGSLAARVESVANGPGATAGAGRKRRKLN